MSDFVSGNLHLYDAIRFTRLGSDLILNESKHCRFTTTIGLLQEFCHMHEYQEDDDDDFAYDRSKENGISFKTLGQAPTSISADGEKKREERCAFSKMIETFYLRFFNFSGSYTRVMTYYSNWDPRNQNEIFLVTLAMGREVGKSLRILFGFQLTDDSKDAVLAHYFAQ